MITETTGDILKDDAQALVNPVNIVGVSGRGLALQFKETYPQVFEIYQNACDRKEMELGVVLPVLLNSDGQVIHYSEKGDRWIVNFPTKKYWREYSSLEIIEDGLEDLAAFLEEFNIKSVAIPALGCGLGNLKWEDVRQLIIKSLEHLDIDIRLYAPMEA